MFIVVLGNMQKIKNSLVEKFYEIEVSRYFLDICFLANNLQGFIRMLDSCKSELCQKIEKLNCKKYGEYFLHCWPLMQVNCIKKLRRKSIVKKMEFFSQSTLT